MALGGEVIERDMPGAFVPAEGDADYEQWKQMHQYARAAYYQSQSAMRMQYTITSAKAEAHRLMAAASSLTPDPVQNTPRREFLMIWLVRASLIRRFFAEAIDIFCVTLLASSLCGSGDITAFLDDDAFNNMELPPLPAAFAAMPELALLWQIYTPQVLVFFLTYYIVMATYQAVSTWAGSGSSLGKWIVGIQVVHLTSGRPPSLANSIVRSVAKTATWLICCLLFLIVFADLPRRCIHDQVADTIVVKRRERQAIQHLADARVHAYIGQQAG